VIGHSGRLFLAVIMNFVAVREEGGERERERERE